MFFVKIKENIVWINKLYVKIRSFWCTGMIHFFNSVDQVLTKCWSIFKWVIWMFQFNGVLWKLQTTIAIAFWIMKCLLKSLTFIVKNSQNWWKWPKRFCQYFPGDHRYDCNCFRRLLYTPWATSHPNIMAVNRILQTPLAFTQQ